MDSDIRDFAADDGLFDPLGDDWEDEEPQEPQGKEDDGAAAGDEEGPLVGAPLEEAPAAEVEAPAEERIEKLLAEVHGMKRLYLKVIAHCREPKSVEDMDEFITGLKEQFNCIFSPVVIRELLEEAGAIEYVAPQAAEDDVEYARPAQGSREIAPDVKTAAGDDESGMLVPIADESEVVHETYVEGDEEVEIDFLEIDQAPEGTWVATAAGLSFVDAMDDVRSSRELIEKEPVYVDIYHQILDFVNVSFGRSAKEIDRLVNDSPLLEEPRRYSGYFVARLEREGAIEWRDGWVITDAGREVLEGMAVQHG